MTNLPENQINELGLELGFPVENWKGANRPDDAVLEGQYCRCEPLSIEKHSQDLYEAYHADDANRVWVYLP